MKTELFRKVQCHDLIYGKEGGGMNKLESVINNFHKWQIETFPKADQLSKVYHLKEEVDELIQSIESPGFKLSDVERVEMEYADCFMLLFGSAMIAGYTIDDIATMVKDKLDINRNRKWGEPDKNGVVKHLPEREEGEG